MRTVRHLNQCEHIIPLKQGVSQVLTLSNMHNCLLERTWHNQDADSFKLQIHAKFDSSQMNGIQIKAWLENNNVKASSMIQSFDLYSVSESSWTETFVGTFGTTQSGQEFTASLNQAQVATMLGGFITMSVSATAQRQRRSYTSKVYFNHLGMFDSLNRVRQAVERDQILGSLE